MNRVLIATVRGDTYVKIRINVPVIRRWRLVWEPRDFGENREHFERKFEVPLDQTQQLITQDFGPAEVSVFIDDGLIGIDLTAFDGQLLLARKTWSPPETINGIPNWVIRASGRGVRLEATVSLKIVE